jgi:hypothetical protein
MIPLTSLVLDPAYWTVISKGIDRTRQVMSVTVQWVPPTGFDMLNCGWPSLSREVSLSFYLRPHVTAVQHKRGNSQPNWKYLARVSPWPDGVDKDLWAAAFRPGASQATVDRTRVRPSKAPPAEKSLMAWETANLSVQLSQIAAALTEGQMPFEHPSVRRRHSSIPTLKPMMQGEPARTLLKEGQRTEAGPNLWQKTTSNRDVLCNALAAVYELYMPSSPSAGDVASFLEDESWDSKTYEGDNVVEILSQLRAAYENTAPTVEKDDAPGKHSWQGMLARLPSAGLRPEKFMNLAKDVSWRLNRNPKVGRPVPSKHSIFYEAIAGMAPWKATLSAARDSDATDPLASIGQAFTLQTQLGMIRDIELSLSTWEDAALRAIMSRQNLEICVVPAVKRKAEDWYVANASRTWTTLDSEGFPFDQTRSNPGNSLENRLLPLTGAHLTTIELRQSFQRLVSHAQQVRGTLDFESQAPDKPQNDTPFAPQFKSGPLSLQLDGGGAGIVADVTRSREKARDVAQDTVLGLRDITIGVRPDLQIKYPSANQSPWRSLLSRGLSYTFAKQELAPTEGDVNAGRMEGYIPLTRMFSTLQDALTTDDELFAWHGWNPALPLPGSETCTRVASDRPIPQIQAMPKSNPAFRYGSLVWARGRIVLRDGSSLPVPGNANLPDGYVIGRSALGSSDEGFRIVRYEPLKAPATLLADPLYANAWLPAESVKHVALGTSIHYPALSRTRGVRYWLPGGIRDISEVDRHGAFDEGRRPNDTAFPFHARKGTDFETVLAPDPLYPRPAPANPASTASTSNQDHQPKARSELPIFRLGKPPFAVKQPYHPDPLVRGLVLALARQSEAGDWVPVQQNGQSLCWVHAFYSAHRSWPDAAALRIEVTGERAAGLSSSSRYVPPEYPHGEALLTIRVPPGERVWLVGWPYGDPAVLCKTHAFHTFAKDWDRFVSAEDDPNVPIPFPSEGMNGLLVETASILIDHFVDVPDVPVLYHEPVAATAVRAPLSVQQPFALRALAAPGSIGGLEVVARWTDPLDDPTTPAPIWPKPIDIVRTDPGIAQQAAVCIMTPKLLEATDAALFNPTNNVMHRPPIEVPENGAQTGAYALPDGRHRYVTYVPIARSRVPRPDGGPLRDDRTRAQEGAGVVFCVPASAPPVAPVVRDVLPSFTFKRAKWSNGGISTRTTSITLTLERGWWSSGPGELLAVKVASPDTDNLGQVSTWGGDPAQSINGRINRPLQASDFRPTRHWVNPSDAIDVLGGKPPADIVLYCPEFDPREKCWRVDIELALPPQVAQPFIKLAVARYQPNAVSGMKLSPVIFVDFIQMPDCRVATVRPCTRDSTSFQVSVRGPLVDGFLNQHCRETGSCTEEACCIRKRRCIEARLEVAPRWAGTSAVWQQHGESVILDARLSREGAEWWGHLHIVQHLELPDQRLRVCVMERGRFPRTPVQDDQSNLHDGPPVYFDQLEFSPIEYNGDLHP